MNNKQHLFLFTIGPVQSFIAQARKTQDLYAGSRILSKLSEAAAKAIIGSGGTVIFPSNTEGESLPNRLLAEFTNVEETELKQKGNAVANSIVEVIEKYRRNAENKLGASNYSKIKEAFEKQLKGFFSTSWVFVRIENGDYVKAYGKADSLLGAVKNVRTFEQNPEQGRKCSLSGEQNALVFGKGKNFPAYVDDKKACHFDNLKIQEKEGLSAISFIKRTEKFGESFDSTADIALLNTFQRLKKEVPSSQNIINEFLGCLGMYEGSDNVNAQLFFQENLNEDYFKDNGYSSGALNCMQDKLKQLYYEASNAKPNKIRFTKYYALLLFDADSMGKWLSGEFLVDKTQLEFFHKHISSLLSCFAEKAKEFVDGTEGGKRDLSKAKGRTVYAGGDDYLGFVNLHYLFDVLQALREMFKREVSDKLQVNTEGVRFQLKEKDEITFSAGITIAHYKTPLSEVLKWARSMEKEAKATDTKDAFGLAVLKHSGEIHKTVLPFKGNFVENLKNITEALNGDFSNKFITSLEREMMLIADSERGTLDDYVEDALKHEIGRLINNSKIQGSKEAVEQLKYKTIKIFENSNIYKEQLDFNSPMTNFNHALGICDFINRKMNSND